MLVCHLQCKEKPASDKYGFGYFSRHLNSGKGINPLLSDSRRRSDRYALEVGLPLCVAAMLPKPDHSPVRGLTLGRIPDGAALVLISLLLQLGEHGIAGSEKYALEEMQRTEKRVSLPLPSSGRAACPYMDPMKAANLFCADVIAAGLADRYALPPPTGISWHIPEFTAWHVQERQKRGLDWKPRWFRPAKDTTIYQHEATKSECPMWEFTGDYYTATRAAAKPEGAALALAALLANERADKGSEQ